MLLLDVAEARHVDAVGPSRAVVDHLLAHGQPAAGAAAHDVVHQVVAERAAAVRQAARVPVRLRVQHDARRLEGGRAEHYRLREDLTLGAGDAVDVGDALAAAAVVELDVAHHRVRDHGQPPGRLGRRQRAVRARVVGARAAAAAAGPAVVAGRPPVERRRQDGRAPDGERPSELLLHHLARVHLAAGQRHRRQERAVRQLRHALGLPADADEALHPLVVGRELGVVERPVDAEAVAARGFQVVVGQAIALPAPGDRLAAHVPSADPGEGPVLRRGVRALGVLHEQVVRELVALVAELLDLLLRLDLAGRVAASPHRQVVRLLVLGVVGRRVELAARLQHRDLEAGLRQLLRRPAARGARAHHDRIEDLALGHG